MSRNLFKMGLILIFALTVALWLYFVPSSSLSFRKGLLGNTLAGLILGIDVLLFITAP